MKASVLQSRNGIQLSYDSADSVISAHVYPRRASNGSTVIVYGHETGLRVVWYAGRRFKAPAEEASNGNTNTSSKSTSNGQGSNEIEVIDLDDSDDEAPTTQAPAIAAIAAAFEEEEDEIDPSQPYREVLRHLDIRLGAAALHLAQPEASLDSLDANRYPAVLQENLVVAVACSDLAIRLVTCPLQPPPPEQDDPSVLGVQIVKMPHASSGYHQTFVTSIALTFTDRRDDSADDRRGGGDNNADEPEDSSIADSVSTFLIASTSDTATGLLLVHQVSVHGRAVSSNPHDSVLLRRVRLRLPLSTAKLAFNNALPPAERHSSLLITAPDGGCAKVFQVFPHAQPSNSRRRSNATIDSLSSRSSLHYRASAQNGRIVLDLLPDFASSADAAVPARRKRVLDSKWVLGGRAVLALLDDGEFGIWDVEAVGPSAGKPTQGQTTSAAAGIVGASITRFAATGRFPTAELKAGGGAASTGLAPATPHTRKARARGLFQGAADEQTSPVQPGDRSTLGGSISVRQTSTSPPNESAILSYDASAVAVYIPSVAAFWHAAASSSKAFVKVGTYNGPVALPRLAGAAGPLEGVALLPPPPPSPSSNYRAKQGLPPNFVASTSTRVILFVQPLAAVAAAADGPGSSGGAAQPQPDDSLLAAGSRELDVDALDRILDSMEASTGGIPGAGAGAGHAKPNFGKSVLFDLDDADVDVDMTSPSPVRGLSRASHGATATATPLRRLFS